MRQRKEELPFDGEGRVVLRERENSMQEVTLNFVLKDDWVSEHVQRHGDLKEPGEG